MGEQSGDARLTFAAVEAPVVASLVVTPEWSVWLSARSGIALSGSALRTSTKNGPTMPISSNPSSMAAPATRCGLRRQ